MQIINNQPQHDSPKNDQNSSSTTPNNQLNNKKQQQNNQSQQRRTAAERRASHRRRSTAQANELVQLAQLRKGIEKSRTSQDSPNIEKIAEEHSTKEENSEKTMIIPNQQMDNSAKTTKNILTTADSDEFPPEPTITAPGSEEEEFVNNENICINLLEEEQVATLMLFEVCSAIEDDDIEFANRLSRPQQRLNRVCSGDGELVKLRNVQNNEDFSPPPSFTTTPTSLSSFSALKAATALAVEGNDKEEGGKGIEEEGEKERSFNQNPALTPVRFRTSNQVLNSSSKGEKSERREEKEKNTECQEILFSSILQQRPFSIIGTGQDSEPSISSKVHNMLSVEEEDSNEPQLLPNEQLARYRIEEDLLERFDETAPPLPPRLSRATRRSTNCSPILYISTCQTLDRRQNNKKLALHRAVSSRANNLTNLTSSTSPFSYTSTLTLPRKRPPPRGVSTQQRRRGNITSAATRRKSIVQLAVEDSVELAAIVAAVEEHEKEDLKGEEGGHGEAHEEAHEEIHEEVKEVERGQQQTTIITVNNLGNATISGGSCVANEMAIDGAANRTISKDNKKRETKTNSMILGTIWSIRPRRKKESNAQRSLVNLWASQSPTENIVANIATADVSVANKSCPNGNGGGF
uniref:Uncharacterized protein n=1 Tax=Meloidogyne javanica TaxID=6303 RepID=A0A915NC29_MELJA